MLFNDTPMDPKAAAQYSPLTLAYLGDCVYEMLVRETLILQGNRPNGQLHAQAKRFVCAEGQDEGLSRILEELTPEEETVYRRGRNSDAVAGKHTDPAQYKRATGLEALFGYLYLTGNTRRMHELFRRMFP